MKWTVRNIYLYGICFVTLLIVLFSAARVVREVSALALGVTAPLYPASDAGRQADAVRFQRNQAVLEIIGNGTLIVLAGPVYLYHWRLIRKGEDE